MSDQTDTLGGRLPLADPAALNPAQREIFDRMASRIVPWADDAQFESTDIAFLIGIYHSVCATLTMFAIPAPE